jgi:hypothetical protein
MSEKMRFVLLRFKPPLSDSNISEIMGEFETILKEEIAKAKRKKKRK